MTLLLNVSDLARGAPSRKLDRQSSIAGSPAAPRLDRPLARARHGAHGARSHARLLRLERHEPSGRNRSGFVPDALDHPLLRPVFILLAGVSAWLYEARGRRSAR